MVQLFRSTFLERRFSERQKYWQNLVRADGTNAVETGNDKSRAHLFTDPCNTDSARGWFRYNFKEQRTSFMDFSGCRLSPRAMRERENFSRLSTSWAGFPSWKSERVKALERVVGLAIVEMSSVLSCSKPDFVTRGGAIYVFGFHGGFQRSW